MKQPYLNDLVIDRAGIRKIRSQVRKTRKIKIPFNFDQDGLAIFRKMAGQ